MTILQNTSNEQWQISSKQLSKKYQQAAVMLIHMCSPEHLTYLYKEYNQHNPPFVYFAFFISW